MPEATLLGSFDSEKWLDIQGFTNFAIRHFVAKCYAMKSSLIYNLCPLYLR